MIIYGSSSGVSSNITVPHTHSLIVNLTFLICQSQIMMMVPVMMNMDGTTTIMGHSAGTIPNMMMQPLHMGSPPSIVAPNENTTAIPSATVGASAAASSMGTATSSSSSATTQGQQHQPLQPPQRLQHHPYQVTSQPERSQQHPSQQQCLLQENSSNTNTARGTSSIQQQMHLQRQSQPIAPSPSPRSSTPST